MTPGVVNDGGAQRSGAERIRVLLVETARLRDEVMRSCLAAEPGIEVVASWEDGGDATKSEWLIGIDVVLVDASSDPEAACETVRKLGDRMPCLDVVAVGLADASEVVRFVEAGASGYLSCHARLQELVTTVRAVHAGRTPCEPEVATQVMKRLSRLAAETDHTPAPQPSALSPRELEILGLVADGLSNKEIAGALDLALSTVKNHVHNLLGKLDVGRRRDAVRVAYERGLIDRYLPLRTGMQVGQNPDRGGSS